MSNLKIIDVTTLNNYVKNVFEGDIFLSRIYIKGEISNLNKHYTGHYYFTLKDENSKISCMMFSSYVKNLKHEIKNGDLVLIFGKVTVYDKQGTYQIYAYNMELFGVGQYLLQLEELKRKLKEEGLFDRPRKKINQYPKEIALITSKSGAAVKDVIHTITSRWNCKIKVYPCLVQGEDAPKSIIKCLKQADKSSADTIILTRGGGENEDLKAFNDEELIRTCSSLSKPLISAIGHQIDSSLVDLVSDLYAITPTEAGEKSCVKRNDLIFNIESLENTSKRSIISFIHSKENIILHLINEIESNSPKQKINNYLNNVVALMNKSKYLLDIKINQNKSILTNLDLKISLLNPYLNFEKGYSLIYKDKNKVTSLDNVKENDIIDVYLNDGKITAQVKEIIKNGK